MSFALWDLEIAIDSVEMVAREQFAVGGQSCKLDVDSGTVLVAARIADRTSVVQQCPVETAVAAAVVDVVVEAKDNCECNGPMPHTGSTAAGIFVKGGVDEASAS